ncbi:MAG: hypothetical protein OXD54_06160 [Candidatus Poribacteria bacterium]|nr:hypothetical protein [Candidatus Poribacteria bacterium]
MATMQCQNCDSERIMTNCPIRDGQGFKVCIHIATKPDALLFKGNHKKDLFANICADCGYISLTVKNPEGLSQIYTQRE